MGYKKLFKIGDIMRYTGISRQTLHNYTMLGLITEDERTKSGHRLYPESVFGTLKKIEMLKRHRTLSEVKKLLFKTTKHRKSKHIKFSLKGD